MSTSSSSSIDPSSTMEFLSKLSSIVRKQRALALRGHGTKRKWARTGWARSANQITRLGDKEIQNKNKRPQWLLDEGGPSATSVILSRGLSCKTRTCCFFFINYCVRTSAKQIISGVVDRKKTTAKCAKNQNKRKNTHKKALFAYYYANVRPLGCHLFVVFAQASYRFLWGSKFCFNNSSLHDFSEWWKIK